MAMERSKRLELADNCEQNDRRFTKAFVLTNSIMLASASSYNLVFTDYDYEIERVRC